ncbi:COPII-coated vesicle protein [Phakopsora pachyrhizi]|nr:COPII-coated vesicle protein [Phakopsora pachyrhizi]
MTITFQVAGGGHLDIDFWLNDPVGKSLWSVQRRDTGTYSFTTQLDGRHEYCFSNRMSTVTGKTVSFNVHGVMFVEDDAHVVPIEKEIKSLANALEAVREEQEYIVVREKLHRNTAESTNDRVKWWSIVQTVLVLAVTCWQVFYLKR